MQYLHILEGEKKLSGWFSQFSSFADTADFPCTVEDLSPTPHSHHTAAQFLTP